MVSMLPLIVWSLIVSSPGRDAGSTPARGKIFAAHATIITTILIFPARIYFIYLYLFYIFLEFSRGWFDSRSRQDFYFYFNKFVDGDEYIFLVLGIVERIEERVGVN